jgi:hypothetical protein
MERLSHQLPIRRNIKRTETLVTLLICREISIGLTDTVKSMNILNCFTYKTISNLFLYCSLLSTSYAGEDICFAYRFACFVHVFMLIFSNNYTGKYRNG